MTYDHLSKFIGYQLMENRLVFQEKSPSFAEIWGLKTKEEKPKPSEASSPAPAPEKPAAPSATQSPVLPEISKNEAKESIKPTVALRQNVDRTVEHLLSKDNFPENFAKVREVLEKKENMEKLAGFIHNHSEYDGDFLKWNKEFCDEFFLLDSKDKYNAPDAMRMVGALQYFLADHFKDQKLFVGKGEKDANRFRLIDGRLGGYTLSVLAEYWNQKYAKADVLVYAGLGKAFDANPNYKKGYGEALVYLKGQLKGVPTVAQTPTVVSTTPVALGSQASESVKPAVAETSVVADRGPEKPLPPSVEPLIAESVRIRRIGRDTETAYHKELKGKMLKDLVKIRAQGPDIWFNSIKDAKDGSWPRQAFDAYATQYKDWKGAEASYNKVKDNSMIDPAERSKQEAMAKSKGEAVEKALNAIEVSINEYFAEEDRILNRFQEELNRKAKAEFQLYDFPDNVDFSRVPLPSPRMPAPKSAVDLDTGFASAIGYHFFETYFKVVPFRVFKSNEEVRKAIKEDKGEDLGNILKRFRTQGMEDYDYQLINNAIYLRNINTFSSKLSDSFGMKNFIQDERNKAYARPFDSLPSLSKPEPNPELLAATPTRSR